MNLEEQPPALCGPTIPKYEFTERDRDPPAVHQSFSSRAHCEAMSPSLPYGLVFRWPCEWAWAGGSGKKVIYASCRPRVHNPCKHESSLSVLIVYLCVTNHPELQQLEAAHIYCLAQCLRLRDPGVVFLGVCGSVSLMRLQSRHPQVQRVISPLTGSGSATSQTAPWWGCWLLAGCWQKASAPHHTSLSLHKVAWVSLWCGS